MTVIIRRKNAEKAYAVIHNVVECRDLEHSTVIYTKDGEDYNKLVYSKPEYTAEVRA